MRPSVELTNHEMFVLGLIWFGGYSVYLAYQVIVFVQAALGL